jgi:hypothetical protein
MKGSHEFTKTRWQFDMQITVQCIAINSAILTRFSTLC